MRSGLVAVSLKALEELAAKYPDNSEVQRYLPLGYRHYQGRKKVGQCFEVAAERTADKRTRLLMQCEAMVDFAEGSRKEEAGRILLKIKSLAPEVVDGEVILINALREMKDEKTIRTYSAG